MEDLCTDIKTLTLQAMASIYTTIAAANRFITIKPTK
jgi:hypothetical protein